MLSLLMSVFAPKARAKIFIRGLVTANGYHIQVQELARRTGLLGWMQVDKSTLALEVEAARPRIEEFAHQLAARALYGGQKTVEISWQPYRGDFEEFRVQCL